MTDPNVIPPRRRHAVALIAVLGALAVVGAVVLAVALAGRHGAATVPTAAGTPAAASSGPATAGSVDVATKRICDLNNTITDVMKQGDAVRQIAGAASGSPDFDVRFEANMLGDTFDLADHARGGPSEFSTTMQTFSAHLNLATACLKAGWRAG